MYFHQPVINYLNSIKYPANGKSPYSARYIGSMVADVHRTLLYGGIFGYPDDKKSKKGKQKDNVIGRAKEGPFAYRALVMIPMADARDSDLGAGRLP